MLGGRTGRLRRAAGAWLGGGRHRVAIICRYVCYVTDAGNVACHGFREMRDRKGWRDSGLRGAVAGWGRLPPASRNIAGASSQETGGRGCFALPCVGKGGERGILPDLPDRRR
jgi:hypothetical protein